MDVVICDPSVDSFTDFTFVYKSNHKDWESSEIGEKRKLVYISVLKPFNLKPHFYNQYFIVLPILSYNGIQTKYYSYTPNFSKKF